MTLDPRAIPWLGKWVQRLWSTETRDEAIARMDDRTRDFLNALTAAIPTEPIFIRAADQPEDSYVIFDRVVKPFGVQLDPAIEVVVVFDANSQEEFGDWEVDRFASAMARIREQYG